MTGFRPGPLSLSHRGRRAVRFSIEVDPTADGTFHHLADMDVPADQTVEFRFPDGFATHWLRITTDADTVASALIQYG